MGQKVISLYLSPVMENYTKHGSEKIILPKCTAFCNRIPIEWLNNLDWNVNEIW